MITTVADASQVAQARRLTTGFAQRHGMPEQRLAQLALVVTELATNLLKHGNGGSVLVGTFDDQDGSGVEVMALDRGVGMANVERCITDGYSTAGSPGNGLGAIVRQSDLVRIYSRPGHGTAVAVRFVMQATKPTPALRIGAAVAPYPGEIVSGDNWAVGDAREGRTLLAVDGAGHGVEAARAAELAVRIFHDHVNDPCERLAERLHRGLMPTRGAAIAIARVDHVASVVRYVGIGNITGVLSADGTTRSMISYNGTAGHVAPRIREMSYPFSAAPTVILHSDGLTPRWDLAAYPGLAGQHPSLIAGVLLRDFRRGRDDASVVAMHVLS
ncbi:MAG TPA: ATP-binding protein [Acetobacteraceae bacterium]|nr:ATP-binding protein [Acetobacteraceae bacterium]